MIAYDDDYSLAGFTSGIGTTVHDYVMEYLLGPGQAAINGHFHSQLPTGFIDPKNPPFPNPKRDLLEAARTAAKYIPF